MMEEKITVKDILKDNYNDFKIEEKNLEEGSYFVDEDEPVPF